MGDGFNVGGAIAELDEKALVVLQAVGCAGHGKVKAVGMVVFQHLANALFEVGGSYDFQVGVQGQSLFDCIAR